MRTTTVKLYSLEYNQLRTYLAVTLFVAGNMILPQLCHLVPQGGIRWLPIYFFTLVGAYKYGWKVGLLTALVSPLVNSALFGMPLLAVAAGYAATRFRKSSLVLLVGVVLFYQIVGTLGEWMLEGSFYVALQDFRIGLPGMLMQVLGGWLFINHIIRK